MKTLFDHPLDTACNALGLQPDPSLLTWRRVGWVSGILVTVTRSMAQSGDADLVVAAHPPRRPDLGLHVHSASMLPCLDRKVETGDAAFDGVFVLHAPASETDAARQLLSHTVRRHLRQLSNTGWPTLVDDAVVFRFKRAGADGDEIRARVEQCVACALAVSEGTAGLDAPHPLRHNGIAAAFEQAARSRAMDFSRNAMRAEGTRRHGHLSVRWRVRAPVYVPHFSATDTTTGWSAHLRFDEPLGVGLTVHPATFTERLQSAIGFRDLQTGDDPFDRTWTLAARDASSALLVLNAAARRMLTQLSELGLRVVLDDHGLSLSGAIPRAPETVIRVLEILDDARDTLRLQVCVGPYR